MIQSEHRHIIILAFAKLAKFQVILTANIKLLEDIIHILVKYQGPSCNTCVKETLIRFSLSFPNSSFFHFIIACFNVCLHGFIIIIIYALISYSYVPVNFIVDN